MKLITDELRTTWEEPPNEMSSNKSANELFCGLESRLSNANTPEDYFQIFIDAPNLLSATIDYNIEHKAKADTGEYTKFLKFAFTAKFAEANEKLKLLRKEATYNQLSHRISTKKDFLTWKATDPALVKLLAKDLSEKYRPDVIVAIAHGSVRPATMLSLLLNTELHFIRFSRNKQHDKEPRIEQYDVKILEKYRGEKILCYDEDSATGLTIKQFSEYLRQYSDSVKTAVTTTCLLSSFKPDFFAKGYC